MWVALIAAACWAVVPLMLPGVHGPGGLTAFSAGMALAVSVSAGGFTLLWRGRTRSPRTFRALLLGLFLGRVALVGLFGLTLVVLAPAQLATGLLSLAGFHFIFALTEVALLARVAPARRIPGREAGSFR